MGGYSLSGPGNKAALKPEPYAHSFEEMRTAIVVRICCEYERKNKDGKGKRQMYERKGKCLSCVKVYNVFGEKETS